MGEEVREILRRLVEIKSPSGKEEKLREFLLNYLEEIGIEAKEERGNVVVRRGKLFVGTHMDTVREKRAYSEGAKEAFGTGVCDAKGSIASILLALQEIEDLKYSLVFFWNEEEGGTGSLEFARKNDPNVAIVMEPTELKVATRHYGSMEVDFEVRSEEFHGAFPNLGLSAIDRFLAFYQRIKDLGGIAYVRKISGGSDEYVIPGRCSGIVEFVFPPEVKKEELKKRILEISDLFEVKVSFKDDYDGFELEGKAYQILATAIEASGEKLEKAEMPSWTDAINLYSHGWDVVVWGPGSLAKCHTKEERIEFEEIERAKRVLVSLNSLLDRSRKNDSILNLLIFVSVHLKIVKKCPNLALIEFRLSLLLRSLDLLSKYRP